MEAQNNNKIQKNKNKCDNKKNPYKYEYDNIWKYNSFII